jgi:hypothetical protein
LLDCPGRSFSGQEQTGDPSRQQQTAESRYGDDSASVETLSILVRAFVHTPLLFSRLSCGCLSKKLIVEEITTGFRGLTKAGQNSLQ